MGTELLMKMMLPRDPNESVDTDADGIGDNTDAFPMDASGQPIQMATALVTMWMLSPTTRMNRSIQTLMA